MTKSLAITALNSETRARYKKEIADAMGFSLRTFQRRLKDARIDIPRGLIGPEQQVEIYKSLGWAEMA